MRFSKLFTSARLLRNWVNYGKVNTRLCCMPALPKQEDIGSNDACSNTVKGLVLCVYQTNKKFELTRTAEEFNQKCNGKLMQHLNTLICEMELGKAFAFTDIAPEYAAVVIASIGPKDASYNALESLDEARENLRWGIGAGVQLLKKRGCSVIEVDPGNAPDAAAEAAELAAWRFQRFKSVTERKSEVRVTMYGKEGIELWQEGSIFGRAQNWARYLSDMPANKMTPVDLAQAALDTLCPLGVSVSAHGREWVAAQRMRAFLAVARGSCAEPALVECSYRGAPAQRPPVLLAAKGVTFDSGGLCLKECHTMTENRGSMAGAAVVFAALKILAKLKVPINVQAVVPICENMISGQCMKVGDVVKALNGLSIQIEHTDMEGRLMMADALVYGQALYKPALVIDVATFTQGVLMATGGGAFGVFSNSERAWRACRGAGALTGDRAWRFPLWQYFQHQITNDPSVDLRNKGAGRATPCLGAAFLKNFVCGEWLHMDITGVGKVAHRGPPYLQPRRMAGRPARTLAALLRALAAHDTAHDAPCPTGSTA
ncbi:cytosol aminopeptidase-like [Trichoplusia ni]|uniref:Cytosol aminopeptidase n=1 Tax=Trichoplusia ni TaxID=7111 RepID=A0A7E5WUB0_TRINI|nr:cytosol aminopeptidase-like [Trichoplusia ni]